MPSNDPAAPARECEVRSRARGPSRVAGVIRSGAVLALLAGVACIPIALSSLGGRESPELKSRPPYPLPTAGGADRLGRPWDPARDIEEASALIYVSEECPYCRSELAHWAALWAADEEIPLWIVASPISEMEELLWVPETLRERVVSDTEGAVGRALGVPAVPVTLWIDSAGVVRDQRLGASSSHQIREEFRRLVDSPGPKQ